MPFTISKHLPVDDFAKAGAQPIAKAAASKAVAKRIGVLRPSKYALCAFSESPMALFQLGAVTIDTPGPFSADGVDRDFGGDHAVKPIVGAMQPREFVGPADKHLTIVGTLVPYFWARQGQAGGLGSIDILEAMADGGEPQLLVRGDGLNMGWWIIEKGSLRSARLSKFGVGQVSGYSLSLVKSPNSASAPATIAIMGNILQSFQRLLQ